MEPCDIWDCEMESFDYGDQFMFGPFTFGDKSGDEYPQSAPFLEVSHDTTTSQRTVTNRTFGLAIVASCR